MPGFVSGPSDISPLRMTDSTSTDCLSRLKEIAKRCPLYLVQVLPHLKFLNAFSNSATLD